MNILVWAEDELKLAGYDASIDDINGWLAKGTLDLLKVFSEQGHSGASAAFAIKLFDTLASWKPIAALTGEDREWIEISDNLWQNKRDGEVFKNKDSAYWLDGIVFWEWFANGKDIPYKSYFTNSDSKVLISFPWKRPESPEYKFRPTKEFPSETL
jgi:hypothetical protein